MKSKFFFILLTFSLIPSLAGAVLPAETNAGGKHCRLVGTVRGSSGYGKHASWITVAKQNALKKAERLNAHHVVWDNARPRGAFNGEVTAFVFGCD